MDKRRDVFQAIADPNRRAIIQLLSKNSMNVNAVGDHFDISRPAISKHLKILVECGLVRIKQEGRDRICSAHLKELKKVADWTLHYSLFWDKKLNDLQNFLSKK